MTWLKKGLIYNVDGKRGWNLSHAQCPVVDKLNDSLWRIYYATRNIKGQSQISYIEVEAGKPERILYEHTDYLFELGEPGTFDDSGVMPSSIVDFKGIKYLFYIGWTLKQTVPYHNAVGLAVSEDGGQSFKRMFSGPILPITHLEPYFTGTSYVIVEEGLWRMWYLSCLKWEVISNKLEPYYHLKYAESEDGINWERRGIVAIDLKNNTEGGIASASVLKEDSIYKMWYSYRQADGYRESREHSYRIGYAESPNGIHWNRLDNKVGLALSPSGWDSQMMCYPNVIQHHMKKYLFYNGNGFGRTGFGYAISEEELT